MELASGLSPCGVHKVSFACKSEDSLFVFRRGPSLRTPHPRADLSLALANPLANRDKNPCESDVSGRSRKPLEVTGLSRVRIPPPPLNQAVPHQGADSVRVPAVFSNRNAQSIEVRGRLQASTGFRRHWRTTGASSRRVPLRRVLARGASTRARAPTRQGARVSTCRGPVRSALRFVLAARDRSMQPPPRPRDRLS
jgi:hypothetical protein